MENDETIVIPGYRYYAKNRKLKKRKSPKTFGGVGIFVKNELFSDYYVQVISNEHEGLLAMKFVHKVTEYESIVACTYLPPPDSPYGTECEAFFNRLLLLIYECDSADNIVFCGDINARIGSKPDIVIKGEPLQMRQTIDVKVNSHGLAFLEFLNDACCCVLNGRLCPAEFTFHSSRGMSEVDFMFVPIDVVRNVLSMKIITCEQIVNELGIVHEVNENAKLPDHCLLQITMQFSGMPSRNDPHSHNSNNSGSQVSKKVVRKYNKDYMKSENLRNALLTIIEQKLQCSEDQKAVDECYAEVERCIKAEMERCKKIGKRRHTPYKPYWSEKLSELWNVYNDSVRKLRCNRRTGKRDNYRLLLANMKTARNAFDKELRTQKKKFDRGNMVKIESLNTTNPEKFWELVNKLGPRNKSKMYCEALDEKGNITRDDKIVRNYWYDCYKSHCGSFPEGRFDHSFLKECNSSLAAMEESDQPQAESVLDDYITYNEVLKVVMRGKDNKACGVDELPYECLKNEHCIMVLHRLFNKCLDLGILPSQWDLSVLLPIPKGHKSISTEPLSFRGIALQSCVYKIYSGVLNARVYAFLESRGLIANSQNGFRENRSCVDHVFTFTELVKNQIANGKKVYSLFVDFKSAFDLVRHDLLIYSLRQLGIGGKIVNAYKRIYANPCCAVNVNGNLTPFFKNVIGTKQGDLSSPNLFNAFLQSLLKELEESHLGIKIDEDLTISVLAYADDILLMADSSENLQRLTDIVHGWATKWHMVVNTSKTKAVIFRGKRISPPNCELFYGNVKIEIQKGYKYLGIYLDEYLTFDQNCKDLANASGRALGAVINKCKHLREVGYKTFSRLFHSCVVPVMDYG